MTLTRVALLSTKVGLVHFKVGLVHQRKFVVVGGGVVDTAHPHKHGMVAARSHVGGRAMVLDHDEAGVPCALRHRCTRTECTVACSCCDGGNSADTRLHTSTPRALRRPQVSIPRDSKTTRVRREAPCATRPHPTRIVCTVSHSRSDGSTVAAAQHHAGRIRTAHAG